MKHLKLLFILFALILMGGKLQSQGNPRLYDLNNQVIAARCSDMKDGFLYWLCDTLPSYRLFIDFKSATGLGDNDTMVEIESWKDSFTVVTHTKYYQYNKGYLVEDVQFVEHSVNNYVWLSNGFLLEGLDKPVNIVISEDSALQKAINFMGPERLYAWQDDSVEYYLANDSDMLGATYYPSGTLLWAHIGDSISPENYKLAWKFCIYAIDSPPVQKYIYVDATDGSIIKEQETKFEGYFNHIYYGSRYIDTKWIGGAISTHYLEADDNISIKTRDSRRELNSKYWKTKQLVYKDNDQWNNYQWAATASHWAATVSADYWRTVWKRKGTDNKNKPIRVYADSKYCTSAEYNSEAFPDIDLIIVGRMDKGLAATPDIIGHEFAHGVVKSTCNLGNKGEGGSLNESYCDIFGFLTERYVFGTVRNWTVGEDATALRARNFQNPKANPPHPLTYTPQRPNYPNYYQEFGYWYEHDLNNEVHHNASVQNHCFYLLAMGGNQLGITVQGIGIDKAAQIVNNVIVTAKTAPSFGFKENREAWVAAAIELFGKCSHEYLQTCAAWAACNVGNQCNCLVPTEGGNPCWRIKDSIIIPNTPLTNSIDNTTMEDNAIDLYPNPAYDILTLNFAALQYPLLNSSKSVIINNIQGATISQFEITGNDLSYQVNIQDFKPGVYYVIIKIEGKQYTLKFLKI